MAYSSSPSPTLTSNQRSDFVERVILRARRLGFTDIYHENARSKGLLGKFFVLLFGTPHLGVFANGLYLKRALKGRKITEVLDAGCGDGSFAFYVASHFPEARVTAVDVGEQGLHSAESTLAVCHRVHREVPLTNLRFEQLDLRELKPEKTFDFVYCFDVLEHIRENKLVLQNIYRALQPNGMFVFRIPTRIQRRILGRRFTQEHDKWASVEHVGQHYEMDSLVADLNEVGYKIVSASYTHGMWGRLSFELSEAIRWCGFPEPLRFALIPFLKLLQWVDSLFHPKEGDGLLVLCEKSDAGLFEKTKVPANAGVLHEAKVQVFAQKLKAALKYRRTRRREQFQQSPAAKHLQAHR